MKKLFALILAIALMASLTVTAFAEDNEFNYSANDQESNVTVAFDVAPTCTVTIPATVTLAKNDEGNYASDCTITAEAGVRLKKGETIVITVASDYVMETAQGATLEYTITKGGADLENSVVATFTTATEAQSSTIHIAADDPRFAGEYKDTVTFTIAVVSAPSAPATISFTIDGVAYEADVGMTWAEWLESSYCGAGFSDWGEGFVGNDAGYVVCLPNAADWWYDSVRIEATIQDGLAYELLFCTGA
jgi:hypothetical protein